MKTDVIRTATRSTRYMAPPMLCKGLPPYEACIQSMVDADKEGHDWIVCHDATDWTTPHAVWNEEVSSFLKDAPDPNGTFAMDVAIGGGAAVTDNVKFLWGPVDLVRRAPVNIAQTVLTLDHATKGRIAIVLSQGQANHMRQFGLSREGTKDKMWDGVQIVRKLINQTEPFSYRGRVWKFDHGSFRLPFYGDRAPEVFVAGGLDESLELAGRHADGWYDCPPALDRADPEVYAKKVATIRQHAESIGRDPDDLTIMAFLCTVMVEDGNLLDSAVDHPIVKWNTLCGAAASYFYDWGLTHPYGEKWTYFQDCIPEWISATEFFDVTSRTPREAVFKSQWVGNAESVFKQMEPWLEAGVTDVVLYNMADMVSAEHHHSANESSAKLLSMLKGHPVSRSALTGLAK